MNFPEWERLSMDPLVLGGKACIRETRVTVGTLVGLVASGASVVEILDLYPYVAEPDIRAALAYAAWRAKEREVLLPVSAGAVSLQTVEDQAVSGFLITVDPHRHRLTLFPLRHRWS